MKPFSASSKTLAFVFFILVLCCFGAWGESSPSADGEPAAGGVASQVGSASSQAGSAPSPASPQTGAPQTGSDKNDTNSPVKSASPTSAADSSSPGYTSPKPDAATGKVARGLYEDWATLKVPADMMYADPMPPIVAQFPEFSREFVQLTWRPWDIIDLYVVKPKGVKKPPVILYLYSFPSDTDRFRGDEFAKLATKNGFAAVGFVSALTGHRFHDRPMKEWFVSELQESLVTTVHDVQLILNYLDKRGDLDMTRVGMFGDGSGASIAIMAASVDPRIKALDLFDPWGDWPDWIANTKFIQIEDERTAYLKPEFLKKVENLDPVNYLPQLTTQRVRVEYLDTDTVTPKPARLRMEAAAASHAKLVHYTDPKDFMEREGKDGEMFDWLKEQLVPALAAQGTRVVKAAKPAPTEKASQR